MIYTPAPRHAVAPVVVTTFHREMAGDLVAHSQAPSSSTIASNVPRLFPIHLLDPYTVAKLFWVNGATVGTDSIDVGVYQMTDLATGRLDLIRSTGAILSANANVVQATATLKVARANLTNGNSSTDSQTYVTASVTLKAGRLYLLSVENSHGSSAHAVSVISGGPTFTSRSSTQYNTSLNRISIWSAVPTVDYTGTLTIDFGGGNTETGACWSLEEFSGVDTASNDGIVQQAVGTGNSGTALATLAAFGSANNASFGAHGHAAATATTPGAGFTETADQTTATPAQALETEWRVDNDTTVDATFTSAQWGSCAVEIKADASALIVPPTIPFTAPPCYFAFVVSGGTATFIRKGTNREYTRLAGVIDGPSATFPLPSTMVPQTLTNNFHIPLAGFSLRTLLE